MNRIFHYAALMLYALFILLVSCTQKETPIPTSSATPLPKPTYTQELYDGALAESSPPEVKSTPTALPNDIQKMVSKVDGMVLVYVPEGEFGMSASNAEVTHQISLDAFWIDQTEVTNAMYQACVAEKACEPPRHSESITKENYYSLVIYRDYPVIYVDYAKAEAYCAWAGRRLPTEAEWEKAARGTDGRLYPWGDQEPRGDLLNFEVSTDERGDTMAVGSYPDGASPYGALDMAGNVWEWVADWYDSDTYGTPSEHSIRGGSFNSSSESVRTVDRYRKEQTSSESWIGFRCAISAEEEMANLEQLSTVDPNFSPTSTPEISAHLYLNTCLEQIAYFTALDQRELREAINQEMAETFFVFADMNHSFVGNTFNATWSPDEQQIAFVSGLAAVDSCISLGIYIIERDGVVVRRLVPDQEDIEAYLRAHMAELHIDEEDLEEILPSYACLSVVLSPIWSPDGNQIAFQFGLDPQNIYTIQLDGSGLTQLGEELARSQDTGPVGVWSPDSQQFLMINDAYQLVKVNADGSAPTVLAQAATNPEFLIWTVDDQIIFTRRLGEYMEIYTINADGSGLTNLTDGMEVALFAPIWLPERKQVAFVSRQADGYAYYLVNLDGTGLTETTSDLWDSQMPDWTQCEAPW